MSAIGQKQTLERPGRAVRLSRWLGVMPLAERAQAFLVAYQFTLGQPTAIALDLVRNRMY